MAVNVVSFSFSWRSTGGPGARSAGCWLSLLHLISNVSWPQLNQGPRAPSAWCGFPYHISSITPPTLTGTLLSWLLSWLSYIIVQRPLSRLLDLWNRMFDRHQAEIIVMQFAGHSLPVHQSMSVPWEFFCLVPFRQPISAHAISSHNCHQNVSLPSGASPWNGIFGRVEGQNTTIWPQSLYYCWTNFKPNYHFVSPSDHKVSDIVGLIANQIILSSLHLTTKPLLLLAPFQTKLSFRLSIWPQSLVDLFLRNIFVSNFHRPGWWLHYDSIWIIKFLSGESSLRCG